jgi:hypothetical protein
MLAAERSAFYLTADVQNQALCKVSRNISWAFSISATHRMKCCVQESVMPKTIRAITNEFQREAVRLVKQPETKVMHIARNLDIEQSVLRC